MPRKVEILLRESEVCSLNTDDSLNNLLTFLKSSPDVHGLAQFKGEDSLLLSFRATEKKLAGIVETLSSFGVGVDFGIIDIIPLQSTKPRLVNYKKKKGKEYRLSDRMTMEEIYASVDSVLHLTFDYLLFIVLASTIAGAGIAVDSPVTVVASMLISPLMGPILGLTFGTITRDAEMVIKGIRNELVGVATTFIIGAILGCVLSLTPIPWPTAEMTVRGNVTSLWAGIAIAIPSGAGVALALTGGGSNALVGIAISASLLPPLVNSGMNLAYGMVTLFWHTVGHTGGATTPITKGMECMKISLYSFLLFALNFVLIYVAALLVFRLKRLAPLKERRSKFTNSVPMTDPCHIQNEPLLNNEDIL